MANEMTGLMSQIDSGFKKRGLDTTREGNNVTIQGLKKEVQDEKDRIKAEKAYNDSLTNTEYAPRSKEEKKPVDKPVDKPVEKPQTTLPKPEPLNECRGCGRAGQDHAGLARITHV